MMSHTEFDEAVESDKSLMQRVGRGDLEALGSLYSRHHDRVHSLCYRLTGDAGAAEDLVQESFLRVLKYARGFEGASRFTTWMYRLVRNLCLDHMAREAGEERRRERLALNAEPKAEHTREVDDERLDLVRRALYRLSPKKREVLVLSRYENLKYKEIAEILGISVDSVKARAHRAILELRQIIHALEREA